MKPLALALALLLLAIVWLWLTRDQPEATTWLEPDDGVQPADVRTGELVTILRGGGQRETWRVRREWLA